MVTPVFSSSFSVKVTSSHLGTLSFVDSVVPTWEATSSEFGAFPSCPWEVVSADFRTLPSVSSVFSSAPCTFGVTSEDSGTSPDVGTLSAETFTFSITSCCWEVIASCSGTLSLVSSSLSLVSCSWDVLSPDFEASPDFGTLSFVFSKFSNA